MYPDGAERFSVHQHAAVSPNSGRDHSDIGVDHSDQDMFMLASFSHQDS